MTEVNVMAMLYTGLLSCVVTAFINVED